MRRSALFSGLLHLAILLLAYFGLPAIFHREVDPQPTVISFEILPISELSNVPNIRKVSKEPPKPLPPKEEPAKKIEPPKPVETAEAINKLPTPPTKQEKAAEEKPKEAVTPEVPKEKKPEPKPEEKPKEKQPKKDKKADPKKAKDEDDLDAVLKSVKQQAEQRTSETTEPAEEPTAPAKSKSERAFDTSQPLSMSEIDAIRSQIERNWSPPAGSMDADNLQVVLRITVLQDGTIGTVEIVDRRRMSDPVYRAAAESAVRAVKMTQRLVGLTPAKYGTWKDMEFTFDPREML